MNHYAQTMAYTHLLRACMPEFADADIRQMVLCINKDGGYVLHEPTVRECDTAYDVYTACLALNEAVTNYKEGKKSGK